VLPPPKHQNNLATGVFYYTEGLRLLLHPKLRPYILVPLLVNIVLFTFLTGVMLHYFGGLIDWATAFIPTWLAPLAFLAWILLGILMLIIYGYSFNMITNIIAAPFYGLLSMKTEELLTGKTPPDESLLRMIPRVMWRELCKLWYFFSRGLVVVLVMILVGTIPLVQILAPLIGLAWGAWSMAIQYADYPADNNQKNFKTLRNCLWQKKFSSTGFGAFIMLCSVIPIVNIFAMPAAVTGGTYLWLRELKSCQEGACQI
jgi:CysZ protein